MKMGMTVLLAVVLAGMFIPAFAERFSLDFNQSDAGALGGIGYIDVQDIQDMDGFNYTAFMVMAGAGYALTDDLTVRVVVPFVTMDARDVFADYLKSIDEDTSKSNLGDITVAGAYELAIVPDLSFADLSLEISLPTGDKDDFGLGTYRFTATGGWRWEGGASLLQCER
ncbi:MAG: hypothetical protein ABIF71_00475 [Planctomycetota bacterium]